jgi:ubiquinol oxidase
MMTATPGDEKTVRHTPRDISDRIALLAVQLMRLVADVFFAGRYGHRAVVLETVAAVPGMVGGNGCIC